MFKRHDLTIMSNPICLKAVESISKEQFRYYDKDGFELNQAEQKFYAEMQYPLHHNCLNHTCWQEPWFELENSQKLILDHALVLHRCSYGGEAREQLLNLRSSIPHIDLVVKTQQKWGFDFALDAVANDGTVFEVIHVEVDETDYDKFLNKLLSFEYTIRHTDWIDAADRIWDHRDQWQQLKGFAQNDWKASYLLNWSKAEYTEKTV